MKLESLTIENFKSYKNKVQLNFPTSANDRSIYLIGGMNGHGKTGSSQLRVGFGGAGEKCGTPGLA